MDGVTGPASPYSAPPQPDWVPRRRLDVRDYQRMGEAGILRAEDRVELIEGELIAMSPVGGPHIVRVMTLGQLLMAAVADQAVVSIQNPIRLGDFNEPQPDIALVRPPARRYLAGPPTPPDIFLLIEIAESSLRYDFTVKAALYARHGIPEYWLFDIVGGAVLVHQGPGEAGYATLRRAGPGETLDMAALPGLRLAMDDLLR